MNAPTGWFPVGRADLATLMDSAGEGGAGTLLAVWLTLLSVANSERSTSVVIHIGRVARLSGVSYRTAATALRRLASAGLITIHTRKLEGTSANDASLYEIHATVSPCANFAQPTADFAEGTVNHDVGTLPTKNNKDSKESINKLTKRVAADAASKLTPENFSAKAKAANCGRLTDDQIEAFVSYWLEQNTRGKCRFQGERYFEMPRRIGTWASRERVTARTTAAKQERPIWRDCARRCRHWDDEKRWCRKYVRTEPKSCDHCREF